MIARIVALAGILAVGGVWAFAIHVSAPLPNVPPPKPEAPVEPLVEKKSAVVPKKSLTGYHAAALQAFEETPGFGKGRMIQLERSIEEIYVHWSPGELEMDAPAIEVPALVKSHKERTGLLASDSKLAPHTPAVTSIHTDGAEVQWRLRSVDLLALVDHEEPVVYVTAKLGSHAAKRPDKANVSRGLDFFEMVALEKLRKGDDMFVRTKNDALRMVETLRATAARASNRHAGTEGDLFAAFSYTFEAERRLDTSLGRAEPRKGPVCGTRFLGAATNRPPYGARLAENCRGC